MLLPAENHRNKINATYYTYFEPIIFELIRANIKYTRRNESAMLHTVLTAVKRGPQFTRCLVADCTLVKQII